MANAASQNTIADWQFWEAQQEALLCLTAGCYDIVNFQGGYRSGKTILGSSWIIRTGYEGLPGGRSLILAIDKEKGKSTTFAVFFERLPGEDCDPFRGGDPENSIIVDEGGWSKQDMTLTLKNGHTIQFGSGANWNTHAGGEYNMIWCDEVSHYTSNLEKLAEMLGARLSSDRGPNVMLWTSSGNGYNQYWRLVVERVLENGETWGVALVNVIADTRNNPYITDEVKAKMKRQFEDKAREREALAGGFAASENRVYSQFNDESHVISADAIDGRHWVWQLFRPDAQTQTAFKRNTARYGYAYSESGGYVCLELRDMNTNQTVVTDEFIGSGRTDHFSDVRRWLTGTKRPSGPVYCASTVDDYDKRALYTLKANGFTPIETGTGVERATPLVRRQFELADRRQGIGGTDEGTPALLLTDPCEETQRALLSHTEDDPTASTKRTTHTLCCDALRCAVMETGTAFEPDDDVEIHAATV